MVEFPGATSADRPLLLYSGMRGGTCQAFEPFVGTPSVTLPDVSYDPDCPVELDVFMPGHGAIVRIGSADSPDGVGWFTDALTDGTLTITPGDPRSERVHAWIVAEGADRERAKAVFGEQRDAALQVFDRDGPGLELSFAASNLAVSALGLPDCARSGEIAGNSAIFDAAAINVYFVRNYMDIPYSAYGENCWREGHPEIVFVAWGNEVARPPGTLAHELGHSNGLYHPTSVGGHTNALPGFSAGNLMEGAIGIVLNVSIGQSYAINFSRDTWLNRPAGTTPGAVARDCQDTWETGACPKLGTYMAGWP